MANDVLASRREARRRRILENSENRLQKITGRSDSISNVSFSNEDGPYVSQVSRFSLQTTNGPVKLAANSTQIREDCSLGQTTKINYVESKSRDPKYLDTSNITNGLYQDQERPMSRASSFYFLYAARLHLICLAVLVRILLVMDCGFIFGESLVAPLCVVEMTEILWLHLNKSQKKSSRLLGAFLFFCGISSHKVALILNFIQMLTIIVQDTCIYFFAFVTFHAILELARNLEHNL